MITSWLKRAEDSKGLGQEDIKLLEVETSGVIVSENLYFRKAEWNLANSI